MCLDNCEVLQTFHAQKRLLFQSVGGGADGRGPVGKETWVSPCLIESCIVLKGGGKMPKLSSVLFPSSQNNLRGKKKKKEEKSKKPATKTEPALQ